MHGFRVSEVEGGASLRRLLAKNDAVDLVLLDIRMPGEDGFRWRGGCASMPGSG